MNVLETRVRERFMNSPIVIPGARRLRKVRRRPCKEWSLLRFEQNSNLDELLRRSSRDAAINSLAVGNRVGGEYGIVLSGCRPVREQSAPVASHGGRRI